MNAVKQTVGTQSKGEVGGPFLTAFRNGMGAIEKTVVTTAEIPLTVFSGLGVPDDTTQSVREGHREMVHGIHTTINSVATGIAGAVGKSASLVSSAVGTVTKNGSSTS
jgi:hypothetical protein